MGQSVSVVNDERGRSQIVNARDIRNLRRQIGMVFQNFNLWPHLSVLSNVTEALV
jgi:octopine/nopaline transport system ATP-binding protein